MSSYAIQIVYNEQYTTENDNVSVRPRVIVLDAIDDSSISASNTITNHPIVSGDIVSDHSYKNPQTYSFSGTASIFGNKGVVVDSDGISLADLEALFMDLKNNAYLCEIVKISTTNEDDVRFMKRSNMVLENIQFTEKISTLAYTLTFRQVLVAEVQTVDVDIDDQFLPNVSEPQTTSFTDSLIDWEQVDIAVIDSLRSFDLLTDDFFEYLSTLGQAYVLGIIGAAASVTIIAYIATAIGACASNPVGWIVGAIVATIIFAWGAVKIISKIVRNTKYRVKQFKYYKDDKKNQAEVKRFYAFMGEIHKQIERLNEVIYVYKIDSNEDQEAMISIDNNYYIFSFVKNNTSGNYKCLITNQENTTLSSIQNVFSSPTNYASCTTSNALFRAEGSGSYVYLINANPEGHKDLSNFFICVSKIDPEEYNNALSDVIINALKK